jgi:hypothetical protein
LCGLFVVLFCSGEKDVSDASARDHHGRAMMPQIENRKAKEKMRMAGNMNFLEVSI